MSEGYKTVQAIKYFKVFVVAIICVIGLQMFFGVYKYHASRTCASETLKAMGIGEGDRIIFLSRGSGGDPSKGIAYQAYYQYCLNKKYGLND